MRYYQLINIHDCRFHEIFTTITINQSIIYLSKQPLRIFQLTKTFKVVTPYKIGFDSISWKRCQVGLPVWPRCGAAWTRCCRGVVAAIEDLFTVGAQNTFSMDFHVSVQVVFRIKLLPTHITIVHLQIGHFFSNILHRWYMLGVHNVRISYPLKLRKLLTLVAFPLVYPQKIVRFEGNIFW